MLRACIASLLVLLFAPVAGAVATIDDVRAPAQTVAEHVFDATLTLTNRGPAETVVLVAALYDPVAGQECGPSSDPRFRAFTHLVHDPVHLPADTTLTYPPEGERWSHRYTVEETPEGGRGEWCVFVARAPGPTAQVQYEDFASVGIGVRARNAPPTAAFTWSPERPIAAQPVAFAATGEDADGDEVAFRWDFGFHNASGRAQGSGAQAVVRFFPEGAYDVTLFASDGFDDTRVTLQVPVLPEQAAATSVVTSKPSETPLPLWVLLVAVGLAVARRH